MGSVFLYTPWYFRFWTDLIEAFGIGEYAGLPYNCRHCELLGMCRRPKAEGWKCYRGCMLLTEQAERERAEERERNKAYEKDYEGLPYGCWFCEYLGACRRPKAEGWKCYNGCRKIQKK